MGFIVGGLIAGAVGAGGAIASSVIASDSSSRSLAEQKRMFNEQQLMARQERDQTIVVNSESGLRQTLSSNGLLQEAARQNLAQVKIQANATNYLAMKNLSSELRVTAADAKVQLRKLRYDHIEAKAAMIQKVAEERGFV